MESVSNRERHSRGLDFFFMRATLLVLFLYSPSLAAGPDVLVFDQYLDLSDGFAGSSAEDLVFSNLSDNGSLVFAAVSETGTVAIYDGPDPIEDKLFDTLSVASRPSSVVSGLSLTNAGDLFFFHYRPQFDDAGIYKLSSSGVLTQVVADTDDLLVTGDFSVNEAGQIVFYGRSVSSLSGRTGLNFAGLFLASDGKLYGTTYCSGKPFGPTDSQCWNALPRPSWYRRGPGIQNWRPPRINNSGQVVFSHSHNTTDNNDDFRCVRLINCRGGVYVGVMSPRDEASANRPGGVSAVFEQVQSSQFSRQPRINDFGSVLYIPDFGAPSELRTRSGTNVIPLSGFQSFGRIHELNNADEVVFSSTSGDTGVFLYSEGKSSAVLPIGAQLPEGGVQTAKVIPGGFNSRRQVAALVQITGGGFHAYISRPANQPQVVFLHFDPGIIDVFDFGTALTCVDPDATEPECAGGPDQDFRIQIVKAAFERPNLIPQIVDTVEAMFSPYNITFATEEPAIDEYSTISIGPPESLVTSLRYIGEGVLGRADQVDIGNIDRTDNGFVLSSTIDLLTITNEVFAQSVASTIGHELLHLLGGFHVADADHILSASTPLVILSPLPISISPGLREIELFPNRAIKQDIDGCLRRDLNGQAARCFSPPAEEVQINRELADIFNLPRERFYDVAVGSAYGFARGTQPQVTYAGDWDLSGPLNVDNIPEFTQFIFLAASSEPNGPQDLFSISPEILSSVGELSLDELGIDDIIVEALPGVAVEVPIAQVDIDGTFQLIGMLLLNSTVSSDHDRDGVEDIVDNCALHANPTQLDVDADGIGTACDPDHNNDCRVDFIDLSLFKHEFFGSNPEYDYTGDGGVNFLDLARLNELFLLGPGPSNVSNLCES